MKQQVDKYHSENWIALDFEIDTSHGDYGHAVHKDNGLLLACWKLGKGHPLYEGEMTYAHWGNEYDQAKLRDSLSVADVIIAHNAKYELGWLRRCGFSCTTQLVFDTKIAEYVLLGNLAAGCKATGLAPRSTSLDTCCKRRGLKGKDPIIDKMMKNNINPVDMPRGLLQERCERDVEEMVKVYEDQLDHLTRTGRLPVFYTRCKLTPVLAAMEFSGMHLDREKVLEKYHAALEEYNRLTRDLDLMTGGLNWRSTVQIGEFIYEKLRFKELKGRDGKPLRSAAGKRKTDKDTLARLKAHTKEQQDFLAVRNKIGKVGAALSKSLDFFKGVVDERRGIFHAEFNQTVTATHRLSSTGMPILFDQFKRPKSTQFQNMARAFKPLFSAREDGWLMMEADGSQLEFRIAAQLSGDEQAIRDILDPDFDAHCVSASVMNDIPYEEFLSEYRNGNPKYKAMRTAAKADTFKPLFGGESGNKKQKKWYEEFKVRYKGIVAAQNKWIGEVLNTKRLITPWGIRFYWPRAAVSKTGYVNVKRSVSNYPIQSFATAEIIPIALFSLYDRLRGIDGVRLVNTVHDSVILEVREDMVDYVAEQCVDAFTHDVYAYCKEVYGIDFIVPLGCGITVGSHWSVGKELSWDISSDGDILNGETDIHFIVNE